MKKSKNQKPSSHSDGEIFASENAIYDPIRAALQDDKTDEAEQLLNNMTLFERDAEWHYCKGCVFQHKGWFDDAKRNFDRAASMDPNQEEYQQSMQQIQNAGKKHQKQHDEKYKKNNRDPADTTCDCCCESINCLECL